MDPIFSRRNFSLLLFFLPSSFSGSYQFSIFSQREEIENRLLRNISPIVGLDPHGSDTDHSVCARVPGHVRKFSFASSAPDLFNRLRLCQGVLLGGVLIKSDCHFLSLGHNVGN